MSTFSCTNYLFILDGLKLRGLQCRLQLLGDVLLDRRLGVGFLAGWRNDGNGWARGFTLGRLGCECGMTGLGRSMRLGWLGCVSC